MTRAEYIRSVVAAAPPISDEQRAKLSLLLPPPAVPTRAKERAA